MNILRILALPLLAVLTVAPVPADTRSPYAGEELRPIKALSPEQVDELLVGNGMGLALAAELNGYPGPRHVLDLADELELDSSQRAQSQKLFDRMQTAAIEVGHDILAEEAALEERFATRSIDAATLAESVAHIGRLQGELRRIHLDAHLEQTAILTQHQVAEYARLRGYAGGGHSGHDH